MQTPRGNHYLGLECGLMERLSLFVLYLKILHAILDAKTITTKMLIQCTLTNVQLSHGFVFKYINEVFVIYYLS